MNIVKKIMYFMLSALVVFSVASLTACKNDNDAAKTDDTGSSVSDNKEDATDVNSNNTSNYSSENAGYQLDMPADNDEIAVMHTSKGDIVLRFFPEEAPKAVENLDRKSVV